MASLIDLPAEVQSYLLEFCDVGVRAAVASSSRWLRHQCLSSWLHVDGSELQLLHATRALQLFNSVFCSDLSLVHDAELTAFANVSCDKAVLHLTKGTSWKRMPSLTTHRWLPMLAEMHVEIGPRASAQAFAEMSRRHFLGVAPQVTLRLRVWKTISRDWMQTCPWKSVFVEVRSNVTDAELSLLAQSLDLGLDHVLAAGAVGLVVQDAGQHPVWVQQSRSGTFYRHRSSTALPDEGVFDCVSLSTLAFACRPPMPVHLCHASQLTSLTVPVPSGLHVRGLLALRYLQLCGRCDEPVALSNLPALECIRSEALFQALDPGGWLAHYVFPPNLLPIAVMDAVLETVALLDGNFVVVQARPLPRLPAFVWEHLMCAVFEQFKAPVLCCPLVALTDVTVAVLPEECLCVDLDSIPGASPGIVRLAVRRLGSWADACISFCSTTVHSLGIRFIEDGASEAARGRVHWDATACTAMEWLACFSMQEPAVRTRPATGVHLQQNNSSVRGCGASLRSLDFERAMATCQYTDVDAAGHDENR